MKIQVLKNEDYQDVENLPKKATDRATGFDVVAVNRNNKNSDRAA